MAERQKILIGGEWRTTGTGLEVSSPYDRSLVGTTCLAGPDELAEAAAAAAAAFEETRSYPSHKRAECLRRVSEGIKARAEGLAQTIALEAGKPIRDARAEAARAANTFGIAAEEAKRMGGEIIPLDLTPGSEGRTGMTRRFPVGTVLGITPFNFPLNLVAHKVAPAMACGCPIIIKPASKTPLSALALAEIITEAGWCAGGVSVVPARAADADALLDDERIKKLTFTGSPEVGWALKARAGRRRVTLELGGNAGVIVHGDAEIGEAAQRCVAGAFSYAGQVCISLQRIYVHAPVFEGFKEAFLKGVSALRLGDPLDEATDVGPMIDEAALERTGAWVREAVDAGAVVLAGAERRESFFTPTVLTGTDPSMKVCSNEVFAPVVTLEPYEEFDAALEALDNGVYGLQAGLFTRDVGRVFSAYARLEVGGVIANDVPTYRVDHMPYGGVKMSGFGREGVRYAVEEMTEPRLLVLKT